VQGQDGYHCCYVKTDGTLWCGGNNSTGQLSDNTTIDHWPPQQVPGFNDAVQVATGAETTGSTTCALKIDGTV
jgi:alpha-tubulin suppressor-like RCC1 family protein